MPNSKHQRHSVCHINLIWSAISTSFRSHLLYFLTKQNMTPKLALQMLYNLSETAAVQPVFTHLRRVDKWSLPLTLSSALAQRSTWEM